MEIFGFLLSMEFLEILSDWAL